MPAASSAVTSSFTPRYIPRNITELPAPEMAAETQQVGGDCARGLGFHRAVLPKQALAERRDARAATARAADRRLDDRLAEIAVQRLRELPGAPVGHAHGARRGRDRAGLADALEQ